MRQTRKALQGDHPRLRVQLLDRLQGHLGGVVSNDFYERIKRLGHTEIVTLTSKRSLYVVYNRLGDLINICCECDRER